MISSSRNDWFPTPAWCFNIKNYSQLNRILLTEIYVVYKPSVGTIVFFPSWLLHGVEMNMSEEVRVSLSFNIGMSPKIKE